MYILIIIIIAIILWITNKPYIENFRTYDKIQDDRYDLCPVYVDSFFNSFVNAKEEVKLPFLNWCNDFNYTQRHYPEYRTAEKVFLAMKRRYDGNY